MGIHDKLAAKAIAKGNSSADFKAAAMKHATATFLWLIIASAIWYFIDWKWALIPAGLGALAAFMSVSATLVEMKIENIEGASSSSDHDIMMIVRAYGELLATGAPVPGTVADTSKLPYPKQTIKQALVKALRTIPHQEQREFLKTGYVLLADWQDGVGDENQGIDFSRVSHNQDPESLAKKIVTPGERGLRWLHTAEQERQILKHELEELGLW